MSISNSHFCMFISRIHKITTILIGQHFIWKFKCHKWFNRTSIKCVKSSPTISHWMSMKIITASVLPLHNLKLFESLKMTNKCSCVLSLIYSNFVLLRNLISNIRSDRQLYVCFTIGGLVNLNCYWLNRKRFWQRYPHLFLITIETFWIGRFYYSSFRHLAVNYATTKLWLADDAFMHV